MDVYPEVSVAFGFLKRKSFLYRFLLAEQAPLQKLPFIGRLLLFVQFFMMTQKSVKVHLETLRGEKYTQH